MDDGSFNGSNLNENSPVGSIGSPDARGQNAQDLNVVQQMTFGLAASAATAAKKDGPQMNIFDYENSKGFELQDSNIIKMSNDN